MFSSLCNTSLLQVGFALFFGDEAMTACEHDDDVDEEEEQVTQELSTSQVLDALEIQKKVEADLKQSVSTHEA